MINFEWNNNTAHSLAYSNYQSKTLLTQIHQFRDKKLKTQLKCYKNCNTIYWTCDIQ